MCTVVTAAKSRCNNQHDNALLLQFIFLTIFCLFAGRFCAWASLQDNSEGNSSTSNSEAIVRDLML
jgi:hypothetical protein